ncbi:hypothetical protein [Paraburkholderia sartisoli]|uniref:Uncharacterized protein n=1 Tax=Paraburkholderia sartisoli TaxID=83784 RepID=A0A1H4HSI0_9BURK|nr:hypothetical protein [Paraburkholderia sartisoli]SEB24774.1 hypothetical protein SAMN05192564_11523 [Paraburkholderia sartisoli]
MIEYIATELAFAALGFAMLFAVSVAAVHWRGRHVRRDHAYWNRST